MPYEKLAIHAGILVVDERFTKRTGIMVDESDQKARDFIIHLIRNVNHGARDYWFRCHDEKNLIAEIRNIPHITMTLHPDWPYKENRVTIEETDKEMILTEPLPKIFTDMIFGNYKCIVVIAPDR